MTSNAKGTLAPASILAESWSIAAEGYDAAADLPLDLLGGAEELQRRFGLKEGHARRVARVLAQRPADVASGALAEPSAARRRSGRLGLLLICRRRRPGGLARLRFRHGT